MRGMIFDAESVRAILAREKTQTRRLIKPQPIHAGNGWYQWGWNMGAPKASSPKRCFWHGDTWKPSAPIDEYARYQPGEIVYVKEGWGTSAKAPASMILSAGVKTDMIAYRADNPEGRWCWRSPLHMPEWAARIRLQISEVRAERLQDITPFDVEREGIFVSHYYCDDGEPPDYFPQHRCDPVGQFARRWNAINGKRAPWESNPFVWVYEFKQVTS